MLSGKELGAAIEAARIAKGVTKLDMAKKFKVKPPSVQDWVNRGVISKGKLVELWIYFADVCGPDHWGLQDVWPELRFAPKQDPFCNVIRVEDSALSWPFQRLTRADWMSLDPIDRALAEGSLIQLVKELSVKRNSETLQREPAR